MHQFELEIEGTIETLGSDRLVVSGITLLVNAETKILDWHKNRISLADLKTGQWVEIRAVVQPDGRFLANTIKLDEPGVKKVAVTGIIDDLGVDYLVVTGITFWVDNNTNFYDEHNRAISFSDLTKGKIAKVKPSFKTIVSC